jgi:WD40 repeat protein
MARDLVGGEAEKGIGTFTPSTGTRGVSLVAAASADGRMVATYYHETIPTRGAPESRAKLQVWNGRTGDLITTFQLGKVDRVAKLTFSPDASPLAMATESIRVYRVRDNRLAAELAHRARVTVGATQAGSRVGTECVAFSPDGTRLATGGEPGAVRVWSVPGFEPLACLDRHASIPPGTSSVPSRSVRAAIALSRPPWTAWSRCGIWTSSKRLRPSSRSKRPLWHRGSEGEATGRHFPDGQHTRRPRIRPGATVGHS